MKKIALYLSAALVIVFIIMMNLPFKDSQQKDADKTAEYAVIDRISTAEFGDLNEIRERRLLRVLVAYSKTNFFFDGPEIKGFDYEIMREYEKHLNRHVNNEADKIFVTFIVKPFAEILDELVAGRGDIAVANFTITPERQQRVQFTQPYFSDVNEVIIQHKSLTNLMDIDDLSGRAVYILSGSSFIQHAKRLNQKFVQQKRAPMIIHEAPAELTTEDIFELINANIYSITVADDFTAFAWQDVLPNIRVRENLILNSGGEIAWAIRKNSPQLLDSLNGFIREIRQGTLLGNIFFNRYYENSRWIDDPTTDENVSTLEKHKPAFQKFADKHNFDWLSIAAMAYQESNLNQDVVSPKGAVGIMQIKPETAASPEVGILDISNSETNIKAGVKYLAYLRDQFFSTDNISPENRLDFTWAAYNAGPGRITELRKLAADQGYDPNKWFSNVERIAAREIGRETVRYVANINKYYIAYKLAEEKL